MRSTDRGEDGKNHNKQAHGEEMLLLASEFIYPEQGFLTWGLWIQVMIVWLPLGSLEKSMWKRHPDTYLAPLKTHWSV